MTDESTEEVFVEGMGHFSEPRGARVALILDLPVIRGKLAAGGGLLVDVFADDSPFRIILELLARC